jgi:ketosteroid isomerase-like protein
MSAADVEVVREMLEAFNRQDYDRSTALLHDEIEMYQAPEVPDSDTYIGKEEIFHIHEVRDRRVSRVRAFFDEARAREAAGLGAG